MKHLISPSILSANFAELRKDVEMINQSEADWFHVDVMDGVFVPNISFGFPVLKAVQKYAQKPLDVHLMIVNPDNYIEEFRKYGAEILTVHLEACQHLHRTVQRIKASGMKAGVSLNPHTSVDLLEDIIKDLDLVLIMSVNPGFGGQSFIPGSINKIKKLRMLIEKTKSNALIEIDGGVDVTNARMLVDTGVNVLVAGSAIFNAPDPIDTIRKLKNFS